MAQRKKKRCQRKTAFRTPQKNNKLGLFLTVATMCLLVGMFALKSISLRQSKDTLNQQIADMEEKVAEEEERATQLQEFETYTHTKKYAEEVAKEVLGYVYDGEIIFQLDE